MNPLDLTVKDILKMGDKTFTFYIGKIHNDKISNTIIGKIINVELVANPPHLPGTILIHDIMKNKNIKFNIFEIKKMEERHE